jgi:hypothetical protein
MLTMTERLTIAEFPDLLIYPDDEDQRAFYAIRGSPRVATDEDGLPQISLVLYGRKEGVDVRVHGGWLGLTTTLQLTAAEARAVDDALTRRLAARISRPAGAPATLPRLRAPDWLDGDAQVRLSSELALSGTPSLIGGNQATFSQTLDAAQAERLRAAWIDGLRDGWIRYRLRLRGPRGHSSIEIRETTQRQRRDTSSSERSTFDATTVRTAAGPLSLTLEGGLGIAPTDLRRRIKTVQT